MGIVRTSGNDPFSMAWEEDYLNANAGTPADGTWYTCTDYSGKGRLFMVGMYTVTTQTGEVKITSDGDAHTLAKATVALINYMAAGLAAGYYNFPFSLEFKSSLKVEGRRDGDSNALTMWTSYGILSEEFKREIIPAGGTLPGRDYTYPMDVMVIWFQGSHGISNKIQFLPSPNVSLLYDPDGNPIGGECKEAKYIKTVKGPRVSWEKPKGSKDIVVIAEGKQYNIKTVDGVVTEAKEK